MAKHTIHHAQQRQAEQMGFNLAEVATGISASHASTGTRIFGASAKDAINQMTAVLNMYKQDPDVRFRCVDNSILGYLENTVNLGVTRTGTPVELFKDWKNLEWADPRKHADGYMTTYDDGKADDFQEDLAPANGGTTPLIARSEKGVALDGAIAYKEGIMAGDNPYEEGTEEGDQWDAQWDQAAEDATDTEDEDGKGGTVVASRYRQRYAAAGHPNHCGDDLADLLNGWCVGKTATDLAVFEEICRLNGVDLIKYNRTSPGWQGRLRMTGRNLLARRIYEAEGKVNLPDGQTTTLTAEWMTNQRYKQAKK